jgi:hypothetical protein
MLDALPPAKAMLGDRGYDADWFRNALIAMGITPCIPSKTNRKIPIAWNRYDRCAHIFMSAIFMSAIFMSATVIFWI